MQVAGKDRTAELARDGSVAALADEWYLRSAALDLDLGWLTLVVAGPGQYVMAFDPCGRALVDQREDLAAGVRSHQALTAAGAPMLVIEVDPQARVRTVVEPDPAELRRLTPVLENLLWAATHLRPQAVPPLGSPVPPPPPGQTAPGERELVDHLVRTVLDAHPAPAFSLVTVRRDETFRQYGWAYDADGGATDLVLAHADRAVRLAATAMTARTLWALPGCDVMVLACQIEPDGRSGTTRASYLEGADADPWRDGPDPELAARPEARPQR